MIIFQKKSFKKILFFHITVFITKKNYILFQYCAAIILVFICVYAFHICFFSTARVILETLFNIMFSFIFAQASFVASGNRTDISLDDPNFWDKWAKKAEIDMDTINGRVSYTQTLLYEFKASR